MSSMSYSVRNDNDVGKAAAIDVRLSASARQTAKRITSARTKSVSVTRESCRIDRDSASRDSLVSHACSLSTCRALTTAQVAKDDQRIASARTDSGSADGYSVSSGSTTETALNVLPWASAAPLGSRRGESPPERQ